LESNSLFWKAKDSLDNWKKYANSYLHNQVKNKEVKEKKKRLEKLKAEFHELEEIILKDLRSSQDFLIIMGSYIGFIIFWIIYKFSFSKDGDWSLSFAVIGSTAIVIYWLYHYYIRVEQVEKNLKSLEILL